MKEKVAIVTGAARGIGREISNKLSESGAKVAVLDIDEKGGKETCATIQSKGGEAKFFKINLMDREEVYSVINKIHEEFGGLDILVNNAGWTPNQIFMENNPLDWEKIVGINYMAVLYTVHATLKHMIKQESGKIVNIASDAARAGVPKEAVYAGSKNAVIGFSKAIAVEAARHNVNVNVVSPSTTDTPLLRKILSPEQIEKRNKFVPLGRIAKTEDIANAVLFFASSQANYVTGQVLSVNGGSLRFG